MRTRAFTVEQYDRMIETSVLREGERIELIEGNIIEMSAIGVRHAYCVSRINYLIRQSVKDFAIVSVRNPIQIGELSEPEPDIVLLVRRDDYYRNQHPQPADVLLLIEVSDSSLEYDRRVKLPLYARAEIKEFWLVNLIAERIEIYAEPASGEYKFVKYVRRGETLTSINISNLTLDADALLA